MMGYSLFFRHRRIFLLTLQEGINTGCACFFLPTILHSLILAWGSSVEDHSEANFGASEGWGFLS